MIGRDSPTLWSYLQDWHGGWDTYFKSYARLMTMKALSSQFQPLLDQGQSLKERISALNKNNKRSFRFELRVWFNSVISQTESGPRYGTESLDDIFQHANFFLESVAPTEVANQIDRAIEIIASIPSKEPSPPFEISVSMELQKLIAVCRAALRPSRKPWERFLERLSDLKRRQALTFDKDLPIDLSELIDDFLRNIDADLDDTERQSQNIAEEYERLKSAVEGRVSWLARVISGITFLIPSLLIIFGAVEVIWVHPFHGGFIDVVLGASVVGFVLMELLGVLHHLAGFRSRLESLIRPRLGRFLGTEESPNAHMASVLGLRRKR